VRIRILTRVNKKGFALQRYVMELRESFFDLTVNGD